MMADIDEAARRREIRRRKILDNSEARWIKIMGHDKVEQTDKSKTNICQEEAHLKDQCSPKENHTIPNISLQYSVSKQTSEIEKTVPVNVNSDKNVHSVHCEISKRRSEIKDTTTSEQTSFPTFPERSKSSSFTSYSESMAANGTTRKRFGPSHHAYAFPKKVSDAESRSYGKTKADACRRSSCTQMMMETLQLSSLSLASVRPLIMMIVAIFIRILLSLSNSFFFLPHNILMPFGILEIILYICMKFFHQGMSRSPQNMLGAALILCGVPASFVTRLTHHLAFLCDIGRDFSIYLFSFVIFHILYQDWLV
ncbi:guided entry of tail-anchored proteins factor CAMLG-like [Centruroides vittatus]|uniref:guided entry of tail-anchored proteins factor CAMLG-like n=1 Tax=Centruroides vittatus TaxID=120091 RepID=UPI003510648E